MAVTGGSDGPRLVRAEEPPAPAPDDAPPARRSRSRAVAILLAVLLVAAAAAGIAQYQRAVALEARVGELSAALAAAGGDRGRRQQLDAIRSSVAEVRERVGALEALRADGRARRCGPSRACPARRLVRSPPATAPISNRRSTSRLPPMRRAKRSAPTGRSAMFKSLAGALLQRPRHRPRHRQHAGVRRTRAIVCSEPSVVAVAQDRRRGDKVLAVGSEAKEMLGRTPAASARCARSRTV
jgi:hypothetical protein